MTPIARDGDLLDFELLAKFESGKGGDRTGALMRAGLLEARVTPKGKLALSANAPGPVRVIEDQPPPIPNDGVPVWNLVIQDMQERDQLGRKRYGTPLQTNNGRDALVDAYQEALDLVVYLRQAIEERR